MIKHLILAALLFAVMLAYRKIAKRLNIIDRPTERTSHREPTIRGGGIIFLIAVMLWFIFYGLQHPLVLIGMLLISLISFLDDIKGVNAGIRFLVHIIAVTLLFWEIGLFNYYWYWIVCAYFLTIGCINAINFMDGINGITAAYSFITLGSFSLLNNANVLLKPFFPMGLPQGWESFFPPSLVGTLIASILVFAFFNARSRALVFAGDVGSIGMAFLMSWLIINLMVKSRDFHWILFFAVYGVDTFCTIMIRLRRRENIFEPHRLHLYQLLVNEKGWPHLLVAIIYAGTQLLLNLLVIYLIFTRQMNLPVFIFILISVFIVYIAARYITTKEKPKILSPQNSSF